MAFTTKYTRKHVNPIVYASILFFRCFYNYAASFIQVIWLLMYPLIQLLLKIILMGNKEHKV